MVTFVAALLHSAHTAMPPSASPGAFTFRVLLAHNLQEVNTKSENK
jgi:hypothetical protein